MMFSESTRERFEAWRLLCALRQDMPSPRAIRTALTSLECGSMARALKAGAVAFDQGLDTSFDLESIVTHAWETRVELELLTAHASYIAPLLDHIDEVHAHSGSAVLLIDDDHYMHHDPPAPLALDRWWGLRVAVDLLVPPGVIENALVGMRSARKQD